MARKRPTQDSRGHEFSSGDAVSRRQVNLPLRRAIEISLRSLVIRMARSFVTSVVVMLAIGFLVYMLSVDQVAAALRSGEMVSKPPEAQRMWIAAISLLVAVVGITNTLFMSVSERYREIGTMKCLGALNRFVVELFLLEALAMGTIGSAAGGLVGTLVAVASGMMEPSSVGGWAQLPWLLLGKNFLIGVGAGMGLTIVGSLFPAWRAALMAPAEAMRTEV
jgi:cell division protein FtsX